MPANHLGPGWRRRSDRERLRSPGPRQRDRSGSDPRSVGWPRPRVCCRISVGSWCMSTSRIIRPLCGPLNKWSTPFQTTRRPAGYTEIETVSSPKPVAITDSAAADPDAVLANDRCRRGGQPLLRALVFACDSSLSCGELTAEERLIRGVEEGVGDRDRERAFR